MKMRNTGFSAIQRKIITLVNKGKARIGYTFLYKGPSSSCEGCERYHVCIKNLEANRIYRIIEIRKKEFPCRLHEEGVIVVEIVESEIPAAIQTKLAIEGAVIPFKKLECNDLFCKAYNLCAPRGLRECDHCKIVKVKGPVDCPRDLKLTEVSLQRVPSF